MRDALCKGEGGGVSGVAGQQCPGCPMCLPPVNLETVWRELWSGLSAGMRARYRPRLSRLARVWEAAYAAEYPDALPEAPDWI